MFSTEFKIAFDTDQQYIKIFNQLNLADKLKYPTVFTSSKHANFSITVSGNGKFKSPRSNKEASVDLTTLQAYLLVDKLKCLSPDEQLNLSSEEMDIIDTYGRYEYGRLAWSEYNRRIKIDTVMNFVQNAGDKLLITAGIEELVELLNDSMHPPAIYDMNCESFNLLSREISKSTYIESIDYLNKLIVFCLDTLNYKVVESEQYWETNEQQVANTGLTILDNFTKDLMNNIVKLSLNDIMEILLVLYESKSINRLFINRITGVDVLNTIYGNAIISVYKDICGIADTDGGVAIMDILSKIPEYFLPCLGSTDDTTILRNIFSYLDYKYLRVSDVNDMYKQLSLVLTNNNISLLNTQTLYRIVYDLNRIKHKSFGLYYLYKRTHLAMTNRNDYYDHIEKMEGVIYTNQFCENVNNLITDIYQSPNVITLTNMIVPILEDFEPKNDDHPSKSDIFDEVEYEDTCDEEEYEEPEPPKSKKSSTKSTKVQETPKKTLKKLK